MFNRRRLRVSISVVFLGGFLLPNIPANAAPQLLRHVVVIVWDGMRPDLVTAANAPTLWKLAGEGVTFRNHHAVYLSATNVNGTALATGVYPAVSGLIANHEFRPSIDDRKPVDVENPVVVTKGDDQSGGKYIGAPTVAELVRKSGERTIIAASKTVGILHDRNVAALHENNSVTLSAGVTLPRGALDPIVAAFGPFPKSHPDQDNWTTKVMTDLLWKNGLPAFSMLWLGEPDLTQHETAPGAEPALRAIHVSDNNLAVVLGALDQHRARETTDVFVVSDHGFSTIEREIDVPGILAKAGFNAVTEFKSEPKAGDIMIVGGGGSVLFYVVKHDAAVVRRLVDFLQQSDFAGVIFAKGEPEGTFGLDKAKIDSADAPDVVLSFRWSDAKNRFGVPGMIDADWQRAAGKGTHATLSRFDMHNTLIAAGPDFNRGMIDDSPSGNIDLAPTILRILGIAAPNHMDGRVLFEAIGHNAPSPTAKTETIEAKHQLPAGTWRQSLRTSRVGTTVYLDEGNGGFVSSGEKGK
ncbi:MAG: hypothetical protein QOH39_3512 [Verrucomicrobiota bacterium]|jgi:arylsulfatase A-like enzyme